MMLKNGIRIKGNFTDNQLLGSVRIDYLEGEYYEGDIKENKRDGNGRYVNENTNLNYEGEWKED